MDVLLRLVGPARVWACTDDLLGEGTYGRVINRGAAVCGGPALLVPSKVEPCSAPAPLLTEHPCIPLSLLTFCLLKMDGMHGGLCSKGRFGGITVGFAVLVEGAEEIKQQAMYPGSREGRD